MGRLIRKDTGAVVAEFSPKGQIREVVAEAPGGGRLVRTREASAPRTFQTVSDTPEIKGLSLPTLEDAVKGKERAARTAEANARRGVSASNTGGTPTTAQLMEQARQAAADLDTDMLNRVNAQLKDRRAAAGKQTAGDRVNDTLSSIFSGSGASYTNLLGTAAATAGEVSDLWTGDPKNIARHRADETREILRTGRLTDGRAVTPGMIPQLEAALAKYEAEYKAAEPLKPYEERHPILSAAEKALYGAADQMQDESAAYLEGAKKGLGAVGSTVVDAAASMGQSTIDGIAGGVTGLGMAPFVARAFGGAAQEARRGGADLDQQLRYGTAQAAKEYITEKLFGLAVPQRIMGSAGAGSLDDTIEKGIRNVTERLAKTPGGQKVIGGILTWLAGGATEGLEEGIGSVLENTLINPHLRLWDPDTRTGQQKFEDGLYDMLVGGISGLMGVTNLMNYQPGAGATTTLENTDPQTVRRDAQKPAQNVLREGEAQGPTQAETPLEGALGAKEAAPGTGTANKGETVQIVQRLQENIPQLSKERHVHTVSSDALETIKGATMAEKARTLFDGIKGFVTRRGFGEVEINNRSVKDDLSHGVGPAKAAVIPAIPDVIQSGVQIDFQENWKGRPYDGYVFAAPVVMDGETVYVAAVVKQTSKNRFYLHEVVDSNGGIIKIDSGERANQTSLDAIDGAGTQSPLPNQGSPTTVDEIQTSPGQTSETSSGLTLTETISQPAGEVNGGKIQQPGGLNDGEGTGGTVPAETRGRETGAPGRTGGDGVSDGGPERDGGMGAGEQIGSLGGGPGRAQKAVDQSTAAIKRQALGKTLRGQKVSSRSLGIPGGTDAAAVTVIPESAWDEGLRNTARKIEQETGKHTIFVLGRIPVTGADGRPRNVRGVRMDSGIILQADNFKASAEQLADHEIFHDLAAENPGIVRALEDRISETMGREELNRVIDAYMDALSGMYDAETATGEELEQAYLNILEEIYADAYAGINAFGTNAGQFGEAVEKTLEERGLGRRGREAGRATDRTTGPPSARYSYGGKNAGRADSESLEKAERLEMQGLDAETIRQETGWFRGMDGQWRFEIDDSGMEYSRWGDMNRSDRAEYARFRELEGKFIDGSLTAEEQRELRNLIDQGHGHGRAQEQGALRLSDYIRHEELFRNYPQLRNAGLRFEQLPEGVRGSFDGKNIVLSESLRNAPEDTLIHEIQHAVQRAEGFARGATWEHWNRRLEEGYVPPQEKARAERIEAAMQTIREIEATAPEGFLSKLREYQYLENYIASEAGAADMDAWERAESVQTELEERYGNLFQEWFDADWERQMAEGSRSEALPSDLYRNTAGEIEARDAAKRRKLSPEERRLTLPDLGDENTVFAEGDGENQSIGYDEDNRPFVTVEEDILDGVPRGKWIDTVKETLKQKFPMGVRLGSNTIKINSQTRREMTFSEYTKWLARNDRETYANKFRAANNADEIILASRDYINEGLRHERKDNIRDFARGTVQLRVGESDYTAEVIVGTTSGGDMLLYDIVNLQPATIKERSRHTVRPNLTESHRSGTPASEDSITQTAEKSKGENQEPKGLSLPTLEEEKPGPRFSMDDGDADGENRPKTELRTVEQELERLRDLDYQTELLRQGGAAAIRENETKIRRLEKRADRLRGKERSEEKQAPKKRAPKKSVAESKPIIAKQDLRKNLLSVFSIPEGQKAELGTAIDRFADRLLREGVLTERDRASFFDRLYSSGVMTVAADEYFQEGRNAVAGGRIYVNDMIRGDFGEDWNDFRKRAFAAGVYLTNDQSDTGVDVWNQDMSEILPGLFDTYELDGRTALERIVQIAEEGKDEKVSLAEYTKRLAGEEYVSEREVLDNLERQMDWALRTFAEKADLEIKLRDRTGIKIAQEREKFAEFSHQQREREAMRRGKEREQRRDMMRRQRENRELRELQQRTLKQLQWLNKNRYRAPKELRSAWDEVLGDIDIYAVGAANEMNWSKKYGATWQDLAQMYQEAKKNDPNFLPSKELERIVARLDGDKIADMDVGALQDLYKAAVGLRTEFYNRNNMIGDEQGRMFAEVYAESKREIEEAPERYTGKGLDKFMNLEQLTPMNVLERMGGWNPEGTFYSMAKQLEQGERDARAYTVEAKRQIEDFLTENREWVKRADGQGEDAIWYELEVPELLKLGMGDKPIFGPTIKVYMTPAQKVHLYLESKSTDNLRHMTGGRTFVNRELYSQGKRAEALAQGITVKLAPETVKKITSDLTEEELALAKVLEEYYNGFASERINRVSNTLYGYDKAVSKNYVPIFTNQNYTKSEIGIYDATAEGVGHLKGRQYAVNPSYNISAFDAFERHIDQTSRFVGMAIPARNWQTLLNWREANNSTGDVITHKWGQEAKRYIENLLTELQGGKVEEKSGAEKLADTVLSNYISSVFGANPSIVFKQAMSFPLAGTYLGWENMPNIAAALRTDDKLINTYTSELAYRLMGYATPETAQLKSNPSKLSENRYLKFAFGGGAITAMDGWTVKSMWRWAENAVRRENPELEIGAREQIDAGKSPFYQEVARRFEEAVSRSQPMYDVMHRSGAMRSSSGIARALTLFKTVPQQQYNMLRQTVAEAQRAKRVYGEKSGEYSEAKKRAGRAVQGVILAGLGIEAINFLNAMLKNGAKRYRDEDEDEMTWASFGKQFLQGFMADNMGMMIGGDLIAEVLGSAVTGDKWYGIETPGITQIQDVLEEFLTGCRNIQKLLRDGYGIVKNGGDLREYFQRHGADYLGALEEGLATVATYFGGVAYNNVKGYALGALRWMSPETETAFQDWLKTADKSGLKGLKDEALETRIYDILKNRTGSAEETTAVELAALYAAGYKAAVPSDTPESVTVDGEPRKLNAFQKQLYDSVWKETVGGTLDEVTASGAFQEADQETREKMLRELYSYAGELAKAEVLDDYSLSTGAEKAREALRSGLDMADYLALKAAGGIDRYMKAAGQGMRPEDAAQAALAVSEIRDAAEEKTPNLVLYREALRKTRDEDAQMAALALLMSEGEYAKLETGAVRGITPEMYVTARESIAEIDGNGSVNQDEAARAIGSMPGLTDEERAVLWQLQNKSWKPDKNPFSVKAGERVYKDLQDGGGTPEKPGQKSSGELKGLSLPSLN